MGAGGPGLERERDAGRARGGGALLLVLLLLTTVGAAAVGAWWALREDVPASTAAEPVVRDGELVDARTGDAWIPRGVVWGSFETACAQGWGYSVLDALGGPGDGGGDGGSDGGGVSGDAGEGGRDAAAAAQADVLASWAVDTVRLPLNQDCWLGTRGAPVSDEFAARTPAGYRAAVDTFVEALNARGMVVVLTLHSRKRIGSPEAGSLAMPDSESLAFWRAVAARYADRPSVLFEAFHEPHSREDAAGRRVLDLDWACWRDGGCRAPVEDDGVPVKAGGPTYDAQGMADVVAAIRQAGADQPVLLPGPDRARDLSAWREWAPADDQLVAAVHVGPTTTGTPGDDPEPGCGPSCWRQVLAPLADQVPLVTTELGPVQPQPGPTAPHLQWAAEHGVGVLARTWIERPGDPGALVEDLSGRPTAWGELVRSWLREGASQGL